MTPSLRSFLALIAAAALALSVGGPVRAETCTFQAGLVDFEAPDDWKVEKSESEVQLTCPENPNVMVAFQIHETFSGAALKAWVRDWLRSKVAENAEVKGEATEDEVNGLPAFELRGKQKVQKEAVEMFGGNEITYIVVLLHAVDNAKPVLAMAVGPTAAFEEQEALMYGILMTIRPQGK